MYFSDGCKMEAQCKDGVRDDGVASLIVAAEERAELRVCACVYERERERARRRGAYPLQIHVP